MRMVAPLTESEVRRVHSRLDEPKRRARERRRDIIAFLFAGAVSAAVSAVLSDSTLAWPTCAAFSAVLVGYLGAILESDRRQALRRIEARRMARVSLEATAEAPFAEAV
jgi:fatty acid desaturase